LCTFLRRQPHFTAYGSRSNIHYQRTTLERGFEIIAVSDNATLRDFWKSYDIMKRISRVSEE
jgi:hypothetical protein